MADRIDFNYPLLKTPNIFVQLQQRGFKSIEDKKELEEVTYEVALDLSEWILSQFGIVGKDIL